MRCIACNAIYEHNWDDRDNDLCGNCNASVQKALSEDNFIRPDYVLKNAYQGLTKPKSSEDR